MMRGLSASAAVLLLATVATGQPLERDRVEREPSARSERDPDRLGWYVPDFARLQTGGFVGMAALGIGYAAFDDVLNFSAHYGFTPAERAGQDVHAASFEVLVRPVDVRVGAFRLVPVYLGPGLLHVWGDGFFSTVPGRYRHIDSSYYPPTALHWTARLGVELDYVPESGVFERHGIYYEATALGTYVSAYLDNHEGLSALDVFGGAVGYRAAF